MEQLFNKYKQLVVKVGRKYFLVGGDRDDLFSEGLIGLYHAVNSFNLTKNNNFYMYAKTIIERKILSAIKADNAQKHAMLNSGTRLDNQGSITYELSGTDEMELVSFTMQSVGLTPESAVLSRESLDEIKNKIMEALSGFELKVLKLYLKGLSYIDISKQLNKTSKSIDNALNRIKNKLQFLKD